MSESTGARRENAGGSPLEARPADLLIRGLWSADGHRFARWPPAGREHIRSGAARLRTEPAQQVSPHCAHVRGHGGVKGAVRFARAACARLPFAARFDIRSYHESIDHRVLLDLLVQAGATLESRALVAQYLALPDARRSGRGLAAGGSLSPLPAALYLTPLDSAMESLQPKGVRYVRFMDDYVICAPTRHKLRHAIRSMHAVLRALQLTVHPDKRFIGRTTRKFDFLGYRLRPGRKLRPAAQSTHRLVRRARRLHEQGADEDRLRRYVRRWSRMAARRPPRLGQQHRAVRPDLDHRAETTSHQRPARAGPPEGPRATGSGPA